VSSIGPTYPAHIFVSEAELRLVADQTANASTVVIATDQRRVEAAQELEATEAKVSCVDLVA